MKNSFSLKEKTTGQILNNFTIIKSITLYFLTHSLCLEGSNTLLSLPWLSSQRRQHFTLSSFIIFSKAAIPYSLLLCSSQAKIPFFSLGFMLYFSFPQIEDLWTKAKANKFFVALSFYKTLFLFSFLIRNTLLL